MKTPLVSRFSDSLKQHALIRRGDTVFVGCSGGPDSTALFFLLLNLRETDKLKLGLLHFNHGLRGRAADRDRRFVEALGKKWDVPVYHGRGSVLKRARGKRESVEEAARKLRYDFFERMAKRHKIKKIALAHTQDDQAETVLMRIVQGTGPRGLSGIRRSLQKGKVRYVRPLLDFTKRDLLAYLKKEKIRYCRDASNESPRFVRNRIRQKLLPMLARDFNPRIVQALARLPAAAHEENELIAGLEDQAFRQVYGRKRGERVNLRRGAFLKLAAPLQFRILNRAIRRIDGASGLDFEAWQRLRPQLARSHYRSSLPKNIDFALSPSAIIIYRK